MAKRGSDSINVNVGTIATGGITIDTGEASKALFNLQSELKKVIDMMSTLARGHNVSAYWNEQAASIQNVYDAAKKLGEVKNGQNLEDLAKAMNAFSAWNPDSRIEEFYEHISRLSKTSIQDIESAVKGLDSSFSVPSLREAFTALETIKTAGDGAADVIQKLNQGDTSSLESKIGTLERNINRASSTISGLRDRINELESGDAFAGMEARIEKFAETAERSVNEFSSFLSASGFAGDDLSEWGQFSSLFDQIRDGSLTAKEAMAEVRREYAYMFQGADSGQINDVINRLISLEEQLGSVSAKIGEVNNATGGGSGGIFNGGPGGGGPGNFDDILQQILNHLAEINTALKDVSTTIGSLGNGADGLQTIVETMSQINALVDELNKKEFKNTIQIGGDTQAVEQLRVYRREAVELVNYVQKMYQSFLNVGHISADIFRVDALREAITDLQTMDLDKLQTKIGNVENLGSIEAMRSQLEGYKSALEQIIQITQSSGIDIQLPDSSKLQQATENVRAYEAQAKEATEALAKETAAAQSANTAIEQASVKTAEIKMGVPEAGASFQEIDQILGSINEKLSQTQGLMSSAFDGSAAMEGLRGIQERLAALETEKSVKLTIDDESLSAMVSKINEALGEASKRVRLKVGSVELPANIQKKLKDATPGITIDTAKLNSEGVISAFDKIGSSLDGLKEKITSTFDLSNAVTQADGLVAKYGELMNSFGAITKAGVNVASADANTGAASGSGRKQQIDDETAALERQTEAAWKDYEAWDALQRAKLGTRESGWKQAEKEAAALAKEEAAVQKDIAAHERSIEVKKRASQVNLDFAKAVEDMENGIFGGGEGEEIDNLSRLIILLQQYYAALTKVENARASGNSDSEARYTDIANIIESLIDDIVRENEALREQAEATREVQSAMNSYADAADKTATKLNSNAMKQHEKAVQDAAKAYDELKSKLDSLTLDSPSIKFAGNATMSESYQKALLDVRAAILAIERAGDREKQKAIDNAKQKMAALEKLRAEYNREATDIGKLQAKLDGLGFSSPKTTFGGNAESVERYTRALEDAQAKINAIQGTTGAARVAAINAADAAIARVQNLNKELNKQETVIAKHKTLWESLADGWRRFGGWSIVTRSFTKIVSTMKNAVTAVKEVDAAMTELKKVTDLTQKGYDDFFVDATKIASSVGSKLSDVVTAAGDFARLGFGIEDATALAKAATLYMNIGDGIESINEASESLISTMKAFKIEAADAMSIVDMFNEVGKELLPMPVVTRCLAECYIGQSSIALCA